jgi:GNAT superfamily N-acetyltransferase
MAIVYAVEPALGVAEFREVLVASTLGERRPVDDSPRLALMLRHANLIVTARDGGRLVGVSRALTDFSYCCYVSDLAVDAAVQRRGIGRQLLKETHAHAGERTTLLLVAAPAAVSYYPHIGLEHVPSCWAIPRNG